MSLLQRFMLGLKDSVGLEEKIALQNGGNTAQVQGPFLMISSTTLPLLELRR